MRHATLLLSAALLFAGCDNEQGLGVIDDDNDALGILTADPQSVDYGGVPRGQVVVETVEIENIGDAVLRIDSVGIGGSSAFALTDPGNHPANLPPGGTFDVDIAYTAGGLSDAGWLSTSWASSWSRSSSSSPTRSTSARSP